MALTLGASRLEADVPRDARLAIDTSALIAYLHGGDAASPAATWVLDGCLATGRNTAVVSALTIAELLVAPSKAGPATVARMDGFLRFFDELRVVPVDAAVARSAARIRASTGSALPDAVVVATAIEHDASIVITNDARRRAALGASARPLVIRLLADYVTGSRRARR